MYMYVLTSSSFELSQLIYFPFSLHTRRLLEHGACTTLSDSNGRLINIPGFARTLFLIKTSRKQRRKRIMSVLQNKLPLKDFKKIWQVRRELEREREREINVLPIITSPGS